jgi:hypothetical protein
MIKCEILKISFPDTNNNGRLISIKFGKKGAVIDDGIGKPYQESETIGYIMRDVNFTDQEDMAKIMALQVGDSKTVEVVGSISVGQNKFPRVKVIG